MLRFDDKIVLVTGASRGIGREVARQFAERGAKVVVHYHSNVAAAHQTLDSLPGGPHLAVQADIANAQDVARLVNTVVQEMGGLDILINNAAIYEDHPLTEVSYEEWQASWERVIGANLIGTANVMYCAANHMIKQGRGRIINVSSRGAFRGEPTGPAYGASKAGLNALGQSLAKYLAPHNVYVMTIAPGFVLTDMAAAHLEGEHGDAIRSQSPLNRVATVAEIAYPVLFLASEGAEWLTGCILDANGASYLRS